MSRAAIASVNHWPKSSCARAFWGQQELPAYRRLLADTSAWLDPQPGERWLDLGCGSGQLSQAIWTRSDGRVAEIVGVDCAAENERAFAKLRTALRPVPADHQLHFVHANFSAGLASWESDSMDGVVSGLALQYAESYSPDRQRWTTEAYDRLLADIYRVLRPGGRLVFSVNVPDPAWGKVALRSLGGVWLSRKPGRFVINAWQMMRYGSWLKREARRGRFHYLPLDAILERLTRTGFTDVKHRLTYVGQAYLFRCRKSLL
jgi:SAM-dependent methyltransferase